MIGGIILVREYWVGALRDFNAKNGNDSATNVTYLAKIKTSLQFLTFASFLFGLYIENSLIIFLSSCGGGSDNERPIYNTDSIVGDWSFSPNCEEYILGVDTIFLANELPDSVIVPADSS